MMLLELKNISLSFTVGQEQLRIIDDLSLKIEEGEFLGICGPSGSGKSTLLYLLGLLMKPTEGDILVRGQSILSYEDQELAVLRNQFLSYIFQQFHLLPRATVLENVLLPARYSASKQSESDLTARAKQLLNDVGLSDRLSHRPNELSGGQQQRVAIARALMNEPPLILADEPTGNLDSKTSAQIMDRLKLLNQQGKTVVMITHDPNITAHCSRVIYLRDGKIEKETRQAKPEATSHSKTTQAFKSRTQHSFFRHLKEELPHILENLKRNRMRSLLTMLGVTIGVAAVVSMITLGQYVKKKVIESYAVMGAQTLNFNGYPNWQLKATDLVPVPFRGFNWDRDVLPLKKIFPEILKISPLMVGWSSKATYAGRSVENDARIIGVGSDFFTMSNKKLLMGRPLTSFHIDAGNRVCLIGYEIYEQLFQGQIPLGKMLWLTEGETRYACQVIGVLENMKTRNEWVKPNFTILIPFTLKKAMNTGWTSSIYDILLEVEPGTDYELLGRSLRTLFERKYGKSGYFMLAGDSVLLAQMKQFLTLFTILLGSIALLSLTVGGMGITNMMLVSVSERLREIGLRRALGATAKEIRSQFLAESIALCSLAGLFGLLLGVSSYQLLIYIGTQFLPETKFEWIADPIAMSLTFISIIGVGILSGLVPALKAEKISVVEALRNE